VRGAHSAAGGGGGGGGRLPRDPMFLPGRREQIAAIRSRERAELASAKNIARAKESLDRQRSTALNASHREEQRTIRQRVNAEFRAREQARNDYHRVRQENKAFWRSTLGNSADKVMGTIGAVGRAGVAAVGLGGGGLAAASVNQALRLDEMTRRLSINSRGPGQAGANPEELRRTFTNLGIESGIAPEQLAGGAMKFVAKTGDLGTAMANMRTFAITAQATGASVEDIASAAADLSEKFDIKSTEDMGKALAVLTFQGKKGAFELKDMAEQFPELAAAAQRAGMRGVKGMQTLGGLAQIARQSTGSGAEASTALQMMLTQLTTKAGDLKSGKALGGESVNVFEGGDATKRARDIPEVLSEIISKSNGNQTQLAKLFDVRGLRAVSPLIKTYRDMHDSLGPKATEAERRAAGKKAVLTKIAVASEGGGSWADVESDARDAMKATSVQLEQLKIRLEAAVASSFFPLMQSLVPALEEMVPLVSKAASFIAALVHTLAQNPIQGIGAAITLSVTKDLMAAGLGEAAKLALMNGIGAMTEGAALALAIGAFEVGQMAVKTMMVEAQQAADSATASGDEVRAKAAKELAEKGYLSQGTRNELEGLNLTEQSVMSKADRSIAEGQTFTGIAGMGLRSLGATLGLNDDTGTLGEASKLMTTATDEKYNKGHQETKQLLDMDAFAQKFEGGAESVRKIMVEGATEAAQVLKDGAAGAKPNRGDKPTGVKP